MIKADSQHRRTLPKFQGLRRAALSACFAAAIVVPAFADTVTNLIYPSLPGSGNWGTFGTVSASGASSTTLPDGTTGNAWQFTSSSQAGGTEQHNLSVTSGQWYTFSAYVQYIGQGYGGSQYGTIQASTQKIGGVAQWGGINFNTQTCAFISNTSGYTGTYEISQVMSLSGSKWCRVALNFQAASTTNDAGIGIGGQYTATTLDVWGVDFINSPFWAQHCNTTTGTATCTNQQLPIFQPAQSSQCTGSSPGTGGYLEETCVGTGTVNTGTLYSYSYVQKISKTNYLDLGTMSYGAFIIANIQNGSIYQSNCAPPLSCGIIDAGDNWIVWYQQSIPAAGSYTFYSGLNGDGHANAYSTINFVGAQSNGIFP